MKKLIDVIIPAYNSHETIKNTLDSICYQTISDVLSVYIVNDKSNSDYEEIIKLYNKYIDIKEIKLTINSGPGVARDIGFQMGSSEYVVFIDSDDTFSSPRSLEILYKTINNERVDVVVGTFAEIDDTNNSYYHYNDFIWLHGKIYKRSFIEANNIHFNNSRYNEDVYYNTCISLSGARILYIDDIVYNWNFNKNSITRNNNYEYNNYQTTYFIDNMSQAIEFGVKNNKDKQLIAEKAYYTILSIYYYYLYYNNDDFLTKSVYIKNIYNKYKKYIQNPNDIFIQQTKYSIESIFKDKTFEPTISFKSFLNKIKE